MSIKFPELVRHDRQAMMPGIAYGFEDPDAEAYFIKAFGATKSAAKPIHIFTQEEVSIDPSTVFGDGPNKGKPVLMKDKADG